jgi:patatin-related protein
VALRAAQNSGLACSSDRCAPDPSRQSADGCALWSRLETRYLRLPSPLRHNIFPPDARPLVHIWTRICAGDPVQLKPATLLPSSPTICRSGIPKRLDCSSSTLGFPHRKQKKHSGLTVGERAELRLALVCYGGVSLAVYMHGVTKELYKLIRAARAFDKEPSTNPFRAGSPPYDTEAAYFDALHDLADAGQQLTVSIDIIAGTSAGGINSIALAKGLALGASQEPLKEVWIQKGDLRQLLRAPAFAGLLVQGVLAAARQAMSLWSSRSPLRGERMSRLLLGALQQMDDAGGTTLVPPGGTLELFVTTTDLHGFETLVPSGAGGASQRDRSYAQVLEFRGHDSAHDQFGKTFTPDLAFSGRATASFPGAFAPVSHQSFQKETRQQLELHSSVVRNSYPDQDFAKNVYFVDGGVLDNAPFDLVIEAISRRRAESEVHRRIIYIEPDPGLPLYSHPDDDKSSPHQRWLMDLLAVSKVKGSHPILRDLLQLRDMNERIAEVGAIVDGQMSYVLGEIARALSALGSDGAGSDGPPPPQFVPGSANVSQLIGTLPEKRVQDLSDTMHRQATAALGPAWPTYQRLKFEATVHRLAREVAQRFGLPSESGRANFIDAAIIAWARQHPAWAADDGARLSALLRPTDAPYRERRLGFILAGISQMYPKANGGASPPRDDLDRLKKTVWNMLEDLRRGTTTVVEHVPDDTVNFLHFTAEDDAILANPEDFATKHRGEFDALFASYRDGLQAQLGDGSSDLWTFFQDVTSHGWSENDRTKLLSRYLGFPLWDGMIFPTISLTELPQFTPIEVSQFSPLTATALTAFDENGHKTAKLQGIPLHHFAAFLNVASRENDYLWGRLDGVEMILRTLQEVHASTSAPNAAAPQVNIPHLTQALQSVLDTETDLTRISTLRECLQKQVTDLAAGTPAAQWPGGTPSGGPNSCAGAASASPGQPEKR